MTAGIWRSLATDELDPYLRVDIALLGLAVARKSPYDELPPKIYQYWIDWLEPRMAGPSITGIAPRSPPSPKSMDC